MMVYTSLLIAVAIASSNAFVCTTLKPVSGGTSKSRLFMGYTPHGRSSPRYGKERTKRQERVGHLVRTELSQIIHGGNIKGDADYLDAELRKRISVVSADVSPDLKQARITVSIRKPTSIVTAEDDGKSSSAAVDRRRAYSWLVQNTKPIRHTLAQKIKHIKSTPDLMFVQADVAAAVDVMYLIDKVAQGYKREKVGSYGGDDNSLPRGIVDGMDFDDLDDDDGWILDDDEDDFKMIELEGEDGYDDDVDTDHEGDIYNVEDL